MKTLNCKVLVTVLWLAAASSLTAQLNGVYLVDNSSPTGGGIYATLQDAANDLMSQGVAGPVEFVVSQSLPSPFAGFSLGQVSGTSAINTVTFRGIPGSRPVVNSVAAGFTQGIRLGTSTTLATTTVGSGPSFIIVENLEVTGISAGAGILAIGCSNVTIRNCVVHTSGSGIGLSATDDSIVENCEVYGVAVTPGTGGSTLYSGGIWAYYLSARNTIRNNLVRDSAANGIFVGSSGSTTATPDNVVVNNMILNCGTQTSATYAGGIVLRRATNSIIEFNSVSMPANSTFAALSVQSGSSTAALLPANTSSNILHHLGSGPCYLTEYAGQFPPICDYNLYDAAGGGFIGSIGTALPGTGSTSLLAWQAATGQSLNAIAAPVGFVGASDLHITPASPARDGGRPSATLATDRDGDPRPLGSAPDIGADEVPVSGLFANFQASATVGPAPLTVTFSDRTFTTAPGGVTSWAWDLNGDGLDDAFVQNPTFTYLCAGSYSIRLTVNDGLNPQSSLTRTGFITVQTQRFDLTTSGNFDLIVTPVPAYCYPTATQGFTMISTSTFIGPPGSGPWYGLWPDQSTFFGITLPALPNNPFHFIVQGIFYPNSPIRLGPGAMAGLAGLSLDAVEVLLDTQGNLVFVSNVDRVSF